MGRFPAWARPLHYIKGFVTALLAVALISSPGSVLGAQTINAESLRQVEGTTETVVVPFASEPWSAALVRPENKAVRFIGHFPGFIQAKQQANRFREQMRQPQRAIQSKAREPFLSPSAPVQTLVFDGPSESDTNVIPPDSQVAAGPTAIVVVVNSLMAIYNKSGNLQGGFQDLAGFFASLGTVGEVFDPRIIYDQTDGRFILSTAQVDMTNFTTGNVLIAVSQTSDPTGVWNKFAIGSKGQNIRSPSENTFPDFPTLGLSSSAIYVSTSQFALNASCAKGDQGNCEFSDTWIKVIGLAELLSGNPALNVTTFQNVEATPRHQAFAIEPAVTYGSSPTEFLVAADYYSSPSKTLNIFAIPTLGQPTLTEANLAVPAYSQPPTAEQPGTTGIATNDFRLLNAVWSNNTLWTAQDTLDTSSGAAVAQWYEIAASSLSSVSLTQSGTVSGSGDAYFPALTVKPNGDVGMVFTTSSATQYASAAVTGRSSSDTAGTMRTFVIYKPGTDMYADYVLRWGDYSGASLDPDGNEIWTIAEYAGSPDPHYGTAVAQVSQVPALTISATVLDFGSETVDTSTAPRTLTVTNTTGASVTIGTLALSGADPGDFAISSDSCSGATLAAAASCTLNLAFTPTTTDTRAASLAVTTSSGSFPPLVELKGFGTPLSGSLVLSPSAVNFLDTALRTASAPQAVTLRDVGQSSIPLTQISVSFQSAFSQTNNCPPLLAPGASCTIQVTFRPSGAGPQSDTLQVTSGTASSSALVQGTGVISPEVTLCPTTLSFASQAAGTSATQSVTLSNTGSDVLTVNSIAATGDFSLTNSCGGPGATLPARTACDIQVTFTPAATGTRTGTLTVTDNAAGSPHTVALTGTGATAGARLFIPNPTERGSTILASRTAITEAASGRRATPVAHDTAIRSRMARAYGQLPLSFERNEGQADSTAQFVSRGAGYTLLLKASEAVLALHPPANRSQEPESKLEARKSKFANSTASPGHAALLRMQLVGASAVARAHGIETLPGATNYFVGSDPARWRTNVPRYARVRYDDVYPGIDLVYYGNQRQLEYDFVVEPRSDLRRIHLRFNAARTHRQPHPLEIDAQGDLVAHTVAGDLRFHRPLVYQEGVGGASRSKRFIDGGFVLDANDEVSFLVARYDRSRPLVIDPTLSYSTYLGGSNTDIAYAIAVDSQGSAYIAGTTASPDFPLVNARQGKLNITQATEAFVTKLSADGSKLIYSTYLGGSGGDTAYGIAVDSQGNAYVTGGTNSTDFPVTSGAFQTVAKGADAFVTKLSADGSTLLYSTYLGGSGADAAAGIAVDASGSAWVAGDTLSTDFPTTPAAFQSQVSQFATNGFCGNRTLTCGHAFAAKLDATGALLLYSTYLAGSQFDTAQGIALDSSGNAYVTGFTPSIDFPTTPGAFQTGAGAPGNSFVVKFSPMGQVLYSTYLGSNGETASGVAVDSNGSAYVTGTGGTPGFPAAVTFGSPSSNFSNAFVAKLHPAGCALEYYVYLGGSYTTLSDAVAVDPLGDAYITGGTTAPDFPTVNPIQASCLACRLALNSQTAPFVTELNPTGSQLVYSTYLSGSFNTDLTGADQGTALALDSTGDAYVAGHTSSASFPMANAVQATFGGQEDAFVAKLNPTNVPSIVLNPSKLTFSTQVVGTASAPRTVTLTNQSGNTVTISSISFSEIIVPMYTETNNCGTSVAPGASCAINVIFAPTQSGSGDILLAVNDNAFAGPHVVPLYGEAVTPPGVNLNPAPVFFGTTPVGVPASIGITLLNTGQSPLSITSIAIVGPDFSQANNCGAILAPNTSCTISATFKPSASGNRTGTIIVTDNAPNSPQQLQLSGTGEDFALSTPFASATVLPGQQAKWTLTVTPEGGLTGPVSLACTGAPQLANCALSSNSVTLDGTTAATVNVTVTTTASSRLAPWRGWRWPSGLALWLVVLILLLTAAARGQRHRFRWAGIAAFVLVAIAIASCGGGGGFGGGGGGTTHNPGTPAGTYTLTLTATGTALAETGMVNVVHSTTLTLTVQ